MLIGQIIAASGELSLGYAERLLKGVTAQNFARLASPGGVVIQSNHPSFVYGHLSLYACRIVEQLGGDSSTIKPTDQFLAAYNKDIECLDDSSGSIYPPMEQVTERLFTAYRLAVETLKSAPDAAFAEQNPNEAMRSKFPTIGAMHGFYMGGHFMLHMGQVSAWRRMMGLGAA